MTVEEIKTSLKKCVPVGPVHISEKDYRSFPALSRSEIAGMIHNGEVVPAMFIHKKNNPSTSPALTYGAALHEYVLEPEKFFDDYAVWQNDIYNKSSKTGKEAWSQFIFDNPDKTIINNQDTSSGHNSFKDIQGMATETRRNPISKSIIENSKHEESFFWIDDITGLWMKCRTDMRYDSVNGPTIADYKSCQKANARGFRYDCLDYNYDLQVAWYSLGVEICTGVPHNFQFVAQEKKEPYLINVFDTDEEMYESGLQKMRTLLGIYNDCNVSGDWYGYEGVFGTTTDLPWFRKESSDD